ncbi:uncharacterized protein A1O5_07668 [Cladophialophora psammophila CBS 110553]|uniref:Mitochondrial intermembrane space import and assembly protein 40 n=1 Tax=Cladophialophora psammophila CBS 110553 TaxID=1182543 RepID=W9WN59_9EURO|nr:uncharacterized protein A1O5_07668 [Cladophialophora psammophila CBS 110553]EXJ69632.1 hypothetical protein A1O5_07668 [Cladophialophora psammophila CBS 110553]
MFRPAARSQLRSVAHSSFSRAPAARSTVGKRFVSTSPANARRNWKGTALRWGIAIAGIYYYNTSPVFAEQPQYNLLNPHLDAVEDERRDHSTLEALTSRRAREAESNASVLHSAADSISSENASTTIVSDHEPLTTGTAGELEEEAAGEGAFNPETGEINWDCPCLGGMAHGPCGPEFREAFSCFVFSKEEPKGMDCIDKFQNMQQCFQRYPEIYKGELEEDEELDAGLEAERQELVNEIAERKRQQEGAVVQRRLLEEPDPAPKPPRTTKKVASPERQEQSHEQTHPQTPTKTQSEPEIEKSDAMTSEKPAPLRSSRPPLAEAKTKVSGDPSHSSTMSPERENIIEGQKSGVTREAKNTSSGETEETFNPEASIVPKAAHDATGSEMEETQK